MAVMSFPTKEVRDWVSFERAVVPILRKGGLSPDAETELLRQMKPFVELLQLQFAFELPADCPSTLNHQIDQFTVALNELSKRLIIDRLDREMFILGLRGLMRVNRYKGARFI